ncbi:agamous-like MADS-box protein AGL104 [Coffea eugenioides]|uniref:agamous-like MADS-box protein AGL104 n=1 Tax=Coffea eugenioides TaxID=49369 RepID=UPI000F61446D|nr:agamous-like MADS-box protein AGL104 [Coffea eugenioides]
MGRVKLPISRIVNNTNRQVTFSKRRNGILKKAYELAVLCDIDIALFMVSPSGRISYFSGTKRIEDVMLQYFNLKDEERESDHDSEGIVHDKELGWYCLIILMSVLSWISSEVLSAQSQEYKQEIMNLQHQLEIAKEQLRLLEPDPQKFTSLGEIESSEERLSEALNLVEKRKRHLLTDHSSSYQETVEQINSVVQYIINAQVEGNRSLENSEFSSWLDQHGHKTDANGSNCVSVGPDENGISSTSAISMTPPSQHSKFASTCQPLRSEEAANYETME